MKNYDVYNLRDLLTSFKNAKDAEGNEARFDKDFTYAMRKNLRLLNQVVEKLQPKVTTSPIYHEYLREVEVKRDEIAQSFAEKDEEGNFIFLNEQGEVLTEDYVGKKMYKMSKEVLAETQKAVEEMKKTLSESDKYKAVIEKTTKQAVEFRELLEKDTDCNIHKIYFSKLPDELTPSEEELFVRTMVFVDSEGEIIKPE